MASRLHKNILGAVGRTPVVKLNRIAPSNVSIYAKCEFFNPMSSVKDRLALAVIEDAERTGKLSPGQTVVEATSGNTGIALAMVCAVFAPAKPFCSSLGYPFVAVMSDSFSIERRKLMRFLGAKLVLTPAAEKGTGMVKKAQELAQQKGWFLPQQFDNFANPEYHANTTGPEILDDFRGERLDYWVTGWGTGGTLSGAGKVLKAARPHLQVVCAEPEPAAMISGAQWNPHAIQGWTPNFVPTIINKSIIDQTVLVSNQEALETSRKLASQEGIFCGISSGGTVAAALKVAAKATPGSTILAMLPDTGERYLSTALFEGLPEGSDIIE